MTSVLEFQCLLQAFLVGRFDADEHPLEVRQLKEREKLVVLRDVQRHFGPEVEPIAVLLLIVMKKLQQVFCEWLVADEVVVDEEDAADADRSQPVEFSAHLLERFRARLATEHHDDVAELTPKRAPPGKLQADELILRQLQESETR